jgi:hypothetical protein
MVVWSLAPRGRGSASLERTSRVSAWALFVSPRDRAVVLTVTAVEQREGATLFVRARLRPKPELLIGSRPLVGDEVGDAAQQHVVVPRREMPAVDLVSGEPGECAVSFTVSRVAEPMAASAVVCGVPLSRAETVAADVRRTTALRDAGFLH